MGQIQNLRFSCIRVLKKSFTLRTDRKNLAVLDVQPPNEPPRGKPRSIIQLILSILTQQAAGNSTLKEIKPNGAAAVIDEPAGMYPSGILQTCHIFFTPKKIP
ncbi:MAG: hypothetical protein JSW39_22155 [Desulfobacterales bacterium]|nr:MAG: hypothetical protein JSW39_22155 [Desulfobacterales bacterium]